ncbi:serine/threonine-protein kinase pkga-related [Anaeramoeba ignava]|uniref:non-specific serine/threonine protein kinase n=1 Tax=Anaeramoeba ignava TaxID=1746090 RepID=A0A9Q0LFN6_ANAIG|nr:serine/threonine-protein kinase pkga-related [Anaeramoeba ignava]
MIPIISQNSESDFNQNIDKSEIKSNQIDEEKVQKMITNEKKYRNKETKKKQEKITQTEFANRLKNNILSIEKEKKEKKEKVPSVVGTPEYLAPEILLGTGHGFAVDWWSLGIIAYELVVGVTPFHGESIQEVFENIIKHNFEFPPYISDELHDLISKLLVSDPSQRLGFNGSEEIKAHAFFKDVNWENIISENPPFVPKPKDEFDTQYFSKETRVFSDLEDDIIQDMNKLKSNNSLSFSPSNSAVFQDFSTVNWNQLLNSNLRQFQTYNKSNTTSPHNVSLSTSKRNSVNLADKNLNFETSEIDNNAFDLSIEKDLSQSRFEEKF